jgi:hypothetical protein
MVFTAYWLKSDMSLSDARLISVGFNRLVILVLIEAKVPDLSRS